MKIKIRQLHNVITRFLNENDISDINLSGIKDLIEIAKSADILDPDAIEIIEYLDNSALSLDMSQSEQNLKTQELLIIYMCKIYSVPEDRKNIMLAAWKDFGRHVTNPATPFALIGPLFQMGGLSILLFFVLEVAWFTNKSLYYKLVEFDYIFMNVISLGLLDAIADNFKQNCKNNKDELVLYTTQMYIKKNQLIKSEFEHNGIKYLLNGEDSSKEAAKNKLKRLVYDITYKATSAAIKSTTISLLSQDPEAMHKSQQKSIKGSGGKTAIKFNVLDHMQFNINNKT